MIYASEHHCTKCNALILIGVNDDPKDYPFCRKCKEQQKDESISKDKQS